jgi:MarR family transcriptional regulator, organic hydroperoxide resistance regulator
MEAAGLLRREPHPGDRRLVRLLLTERGRSLEHVIAAETDKLTGRAGHSRADRTRCAHRRAERHPPEPRRW